ncbi:MAG: transposase [Actinobacteria bacterium]|nr:transposase [Actinomycetota bacterium]
MRSAQGVLIDDGSDAEDVRHFAVVTNRWDLDGQTLLQWHRGKAGTIEQVHRVIKDELAGRVYPSGKFGDNAAWLRLQVLTYNLLELLKAAALAPELRHARPKRLRFLVFTHIGKLVSHAGQGMMKVARELFEKLLEPPRARIRLLAWSAS